MTLLEYRIFFNAISRDIRLVHHRQRNGICFIQNQKQILVPFFCLTRHTPRQQCLHLFLTICIAAFEILFLFFTALVSGITVVISAMFRGIVNVTSDVSHFHQLQFRILVLIFPNF